jgi:hypothetical protein
MSLDLMIKARSTCDAADAIYEPAVATARLVAIRGEVDH